jgi:probable addiction module antidote protein/putative addiction module killer protein
MLEVRETAAYANWFKGLRDRAAKARIDIRVRRLSLGNPGDVRPIGEGVSELRIQLGPGYRIYFIQEKPMTKTVTTRWDPADHLVSSEDMAAYLEAALEDGDPKVIAVALGDIARAKGMSQIARDAGLGRESLYKALSAGGNPELGTILKVISALGLQLHASPADEAKAAV